MYFCNQIANMYSMIKRSITSILQHRLKKFPIVSLTGPRQSGKTTLLRNELPNYKYFNLERLDLRQLIIEDPIGFLQHQGEKIIFDEVQRVPELFNYIQVISDERGSAGQYVLSGSQSFLMNENISQSLAGRVQISHLLPFDTSEIEEPEDIYSAIYKGFYPRIYDFDIEPNEFYSSYIQTYIERDVRNIKSIENLGSFIRFLGLCAGRIGQVLNFSSLANDAGISVNTVKSWLSLLEASYIIYRLPPYYKNYNKRLIKSHKIYFYDTGVVCALLGIRSAEMVQTHYLYGALFENFVISEIVKHHYHAGLKPDIFFWRDNNGVEIDCLVESPSRFLYAIEIKGGATMNKDYVKNLKRFPAKDNVLRHVIYTGKENIILPEYQLIAYSNIKTLIQKIISINK